MKTILTLLMLGTISLLIFENSYANITPLPPSNPQEAPVTGGGVIGGDSGLSAVLAFLGIASAIAGTFTALSGLEKYVKTNQIRFFQERINFTVKPDGTVQVVGAFSLKNNSKKDKTIRMVFPFPKEVYLEPATGISMKLNQPDQKLEYEQVEGINCCVCEVMLKAGEITVMEIKYSQKSTQNRFKYLLRSIMIWGDKMNDADFTIQLPKNMALESTNYNCQKSPASGDYNVYTINRKDFMPTKDLEFAWVNK